MAISQQQEQETPIKLISECFVKPKYEPTKQPYHCGPIDLVFLTTEPIQKGLLFTLNNSPIFNESQDINFIRTKIVSNLLENLKRSLSIALIYFYPLAGRYTIQKYPDDNACSIYIDCNKGPGARFIHATALGLAVSDVLSPVDVSIAHPFFDLGERFVNYDCHTKALLSIQVTELLDGVFIGFSLSHSVGDGASYIHFVNVLSEIFRSLNNNESETSESDVIKVSREPILNYRPWNVQIPKFPFLDIEEFICREYNPGPLMEKFFHVSPSSMAKLKAKANQECDTHNVISSFQALIVLVWRSITRARNLPRDQQTNYILVMGARNRLNPPISDNYFGNFIRRTKWGCKVEELLGNSLGWAAMNVHKNIKANNGDEILDFYNKAASSPFLIPRRIEPEHSDVNIAGSPWFDTYGPEFGLGRALAIRTGYGNKNDGKVTANPGCEGGGSVDLEICLRPSIMAALEADQEFRCFVSLD